MDGFPGFHAPSVLPFPPQPPTPSPGRGQPAASEEKNVPSCVRACARAWLCLCERARGSEEREGEQQGKRSGEREGIGGRRGRERWKEDGGLQFQV